MTGLTFEVALCYLDNLIIFSKTIEEHLERLRLVLERLKEAGLKLKPIKCKLFIIIIIIMPSFTDLGGVFGPHRLSRTDCCEPCQDSCGGGLAGARKRA